MDMGTWARADGQGAYGQGGHELRQIDKGALTRAYGQGEMGKSEKAKEQGKGERWRGIAGE